MKAGPNPIQTLISILNARSNTWRRTQVLTFTRIERGDRTFQFHSRPESHEIAQDEEQSTNYAR